MPPGRPSEYSDEIAEEILTRIMGGESLREVCRSGGMPARSTVHLWVAKGKEGEEPYNTFSDRYAKACEIRAYEMFDELMEIADNGSNDWMDRNGEGEGWQLNGEALQRSRLRVDARKWALSKMIPKTFGDKVEVDNTSSDGSMTPQPATIVIQGVPADHDDSDN